MSEFAESIGDIRKTLGSVETQMSHINDIMAEKLFLDLGTFTGKGALKQSKLSRCWRIILRKRYFFLSLLQKDQRLSMEKPT